MGNRRARGNDNCPRSRRSAVPLDAPERSQESEAKVFAWFTLNPRCWVTNRELSRLTGTPGRSVRAATRRFAESAIAECIELADGFQFKMRKVAKPNAYVEKLAAVAAMLPEVREESELRKRGHEVTSNARMLFRPGCRGL